MGGELERAPGEQKLWLPTYLYLLNVCSVRHLNALRSFRLEIRIWSTNTIHFELCLTNWAGQVFDNFFLRWHCVVLHMKSPSLGVVCRELCRKTPSTSALPTKTVLLINDGGIGASTVVFRSALLWEWLKKVLMSLRRNFYNIIIYE